MSHVAALAETVEKCLQQEVDGRKGWQAVVDHVLLLVDTLNEIYLETDKSWDVIGLEHKISRSQLIRFRKVHKFRFLQVCLYICASFSSPAPPPHHYNHHDHHPHPPHLILLIYPVTDDIVTSLILVSFPSATTSSGLGT